MIDRKTSLRIAWLAVAASLSGCASAQRAPDLTELYRETANAGVEERNPLVIAPGTLGSRLVHAPSGELVWGGEDFSADPDSDEGVRRLALPIGDGETPLAALRDDIRPDGLLEAAQVSFLGAVISEGVYDGIVNTLSVGGYRRFLPQRAADELEGRLAALTEGAADPAGEIAKAAGGGAASDDADNAPPENSVIFAYDWRRDLAETGAELYRMLAEKREIISAMRVNDAAAIGPDDQIKFDLVAHSMGGLAVRYFLLYGDAPLTNEGALPEITWKGAELVEKVVIVGTPHAGSAIAFENLVNGKSFSPLTPDFQAALLGTHPSVYQLLPRDRHRRVWWDGDPARPVNTIYDVDVWDRYSWGLLSPQADDELAVLLPSVLTPEARRARAKAHLAHLLKRAERFHRAIDRPAAPPPGLDKFLVVGGGFATPAIASVEAETGAVAIAAREEGDGVVLRSSALLDERVGGAFSAGLRSPLSFRATLFLPEEHVELTKSEVFGDNLLFWLLEEPRREPRGRLESPRLSDTEVRRASLDRQNYDVLQSSGER